MTTLLKHRTALARNPEAYEKDIKRCYKTVVKHLKDAGYKLITLKRARSTIEKFVNIIFDAQGRKPFFHINSKLPYCWNSTKRKNHPSPWKLNYILYEWGHLKSRNQNKKAVYINIENFGLYSASVLTI